MDYNLNSEIMEEQCRICLQKGDINIWHSKVTLKTDKAVVNAESMDDSTNKTFFDLMDVFTTKEDLLVLTNEFPNICLKCLEDLKFCNLIYEKITQSNVQLKILNEQFLNQRLDEEHLIEYEVEEQDQTNSEQIHYDSIVENTEMAPINDLSTKYIQQSMVDEEKPVNDNLLQINRSKRIALGSNDTFVITQFVPTTLETSQRVFQSQCNKDEEQDSVTAQHLFTMNLEAVEVKDIKNLAHPQTLELDSFQAAIYVCQYCPQAFAKADYLKTHIQKSHVCKFCTEAFNITEDLFKHIREVHTVHKCVICHKILSSHTNLRHHIRRVHRINLPAKVTLMDFIKSSNQCENQIESNIECLQDIAELDDMESNIQYIWDSSDNIEILNEH